MANPELAGALKSSSQAVQDSGLCDSAHDCLDYGDVPGQITLSMEDFGRLGAEDENLTDEEALRRVARLLGAMDAMVTLGKFDADDAIDSPQLPPHLEEIRRSAHTEYVHSDRMFAAWQVYVAEVVRKGFVRSPAAGRAPRKRRIRARSGSRGSPGGSADESYPVNM